MRDGAADTAGGWELMTHEGGECGPAGGSWRADRTGTTPQCDPLLPVSAYHSTAVKRKKRRVAVSGCGWQ
jgi:hypothetical protein